MGDPGRKATCADDFHDGTSDGVEYLAMATGPWIAYGYRCPTCGFETLTTSTYVPVSKQCSACGQTFDGMPDADGELCDQCFTSRLDVMFQKPSG